MLTVTFIRHGQSEDNPKGIWAGWKDAPLSELGQRQAKALGENLASTHINYVYASPLLRARDTGLAVQTRQPHAPPFTENPNLREQHFGIAEGHPWTVTYPEDLTLEQCFEQGLFPADVEKFPGGESEEDLHRRAHVAIKETVFPHLEEAAKKDIHVALASHGLCIGELIKALLTYDPKHKNNDFFTGLENTAWTRVVLNIDPSYVPVDTPTFTAKVALRDQSRHLRDLHSHVAQATDAEDEARKAEALAFFGGDKKVAEGHLHAPSPGSRI